MEEIRVDSWGALQERLFDDSWNSQLGLYRSNYAFRGRWDAQDDLSNAGAGNHDDLSFFSNCMCGQTRPASAPMP